MMGLMEAAVATAGTAYGGNPALSGVSTDTRTIGAGELFVALRGENHDGHDFLPAAIERGAAAAMVQADWFAGRSMSLPALVVPDTRAALGALAADWRRRFDLPLIGVTGSNGKTTVKEMCAAILRARAIAEDLDPELAVLATRGNLNNDIGLPLTLLGLRSPHRAAVVEMGMNHPGEIACLAGMAAPTVAVVTNAQRAHLEGLGSVGDVAREKGAIYGGLMPGGTAVINADDPFAALWSELAAGRRQVSFGLGEAAQVTGTWSARGAGTVLRMQSPWGGAEVSLKVPGVHNVRNALAAAAATLAAGLPMKAVVAGLQGFTGVKGRLQFRAGKRGAILIDDTYNANPDSVRAAIDVLAALPGRKILVLGDMGEIGTRSGQFHDEIGGYAKSQGVDLLLSAGEHAELAARNFGAGGRHFPRIEALCAALLEEMADGTAVLVKGSRFMRMERVVEAVAEAAGA